MTFVTVQLDITDQNKNLEMQLKLISLKTCFGFVTQVESVVCYSDIKNTSFINSFHIPKSKFQIDLETVDEEPPRGNATANSYYYY